MTPDPVAKKTVKCPHCGHEQLESVEAISTNCRQCQTYFRVKEAPKKKVTRLNQPRNEIVCYACGHEQRVVATALSSQCERCNTFLNLKNYVITGRSSEKIRTYGSVLFAPGCIYRSTEIHALQITVAGDVTARVIADTEIILQQQGRIQGRLTAPQIIVEANAQSHAARIFTPKMEVHGALHCQQARISMQLIVRAGGYFEAEKIITPSVTVEPGGRLGGYLETTTSVSLDEPEDNPSRANE